MTHRGNSPHQVSSQNLILFPSPSSKIQFYFKFTASKFIHFQRPLPALPLGGFGNQPPSSVPYFKLMTIFQTVFSSSANLLAHLVKSALFIRIRLMIPRPPFIFHRQTFSHFIKWIFLSVELLPQRKSLWIFSSLELTLLGIRKRDIT